RTMAGPRTPRESRAPGRGSAPRSSPGARPHSAVSSTSSAGTRLWIENKKRGASMSKSVKDAMTVNPCTIDADQTVAWAARMMRDEDVGLAPVVEGQRLVGTLTDRDIAVRVVAEGKDPQVVKVREVASTDLVTVDPQQDLDEALRLMADH